MGFYLCLSKYSYIYILVLLFFACVCVLFAWQHPSALITSAQTLTFCSRGERREDLKSHLSLLFNVCESVCLETCMNTCVQAMGVPAWWTFLCEASWWERRLVTLFSNCVCICMEKNLHKCLYFSAGLKDLVRDTGIIIIIILFLFLFTFFPHVLSHQLTLKISDQLMWKTIIFSWNLKSLSPCGLIMFQVHLWVNLFFPPFIRSCFICLPSASLG